MDGVAISTQMGRRWLDLMFGPKHWGDAENSLKEEGECRE